MLTVRVHPRHRSVWPERRDWLLTAAVAVVTAVLVFFGPEDDGHQPDALGWVLLTATVLVVAWRRRFPLGALLALLVVVAPYHMLDNRHMAASVAAMISIYSLAVAGPRRRTLIVIPVVLVVPAVAVFFKDPAQIAEMGRTAGWILLPPLLGEAVRVHRNYIAAIVERAERAERTREEVAARRVAEERLRIARDLHDLLAHSITVIGVQTSVAAHVLVADPERLDREALAASLDSIADTCRDARQELRTTLKVLRSGETAGVGGGAGAGRGVGPGTGPGTGPGAGAGAGTVPVGEAVGGGTVGAGRVGAGQPVGAGGTSAAGRAPGPVGGAPDRGPLPGLAGLADLAEAARAAGTTVELSLDGAAEDASGETSPGEATSAPARGPVPPAVGAAAYRIVQQSLTNAVQHAGPGAAIRVRLTRDDAALRVSVTDSGPGAAGLPGSRPKPPDSAEPSGGYGIPGMRERARSVGGTLAAGPRTDGKPGFAVTAELPLAAQ